MGGISEGKEDIRVADNKLELCEIDGRDGYDQLYLDHSKEMLKDILFGLIAKKTFIIGRIIREGKNPNLYFGLKGTGDTWMALPTDALKTQILKIFDLLTNKGDFDTTAEYIEFLK